MKKKLWFIILCFFILVPSVNGKYCTDYSDSNCSNHKTDDKKNTCAVIDGRCDFKKIKTPCSSVKPKKKYLIFGEKSCGLDSTGQLCTYDETTEKCINAATNQNHKLCSDYNADNCPDYADGVACSPTANACITKEEFENNVSNTEDTTDTETTAYTDTEEGSTGQIKAITCTGDAKDQIPENLPIFVRGLYNILKLLVPSIIIILGMLDFFKAATSGNESDMDGQKSKFIRRILGGIMIFLVMVISQWVFGLIGEKDNFMGCVSCFLSSGEDCIDAGYIDPAVNDRQNKSPNKTPPKSTNTAVIGGLVNPDAEKILKEAKWVTDYVRKHKFTYGDAPYNPAMNHAAKKVSCDRCVGWVLYRLGFKDQPKVQGLTVWNPNKERDMTAWVKKHGFKRISNMSDVQPGDIIFQRAGAVGKTVSHVFILGNKRKNGKWERYDCGTPERILTKQPLVMDLPKVRFLYAYRITLKS